MMDLIVSTSKDISFKIKISESKLLMRNVGIFCIFGGKSHVVAGGGSLGATQITILKEKLASANHPCEVSI